MEDKRHAEKILEELKDHFGVSSISALARFLSGDKFKFTPNAIYLWQKRNKIPIDKIAQNHPEINRRFLKTGEGNVVATDDATPWPEHNKEEQIAREIEFLRRDTPYLRFLDKVNRSREIYDELYGSELSINDKVRIEREILVALGDAIKDALGE